MRVDLSCIPTYRSKRKIHALQVTKFDRDSETGIPYAYFVDSPPLRVTDLLMDTFSRMSKCYILLDEHGIVSVMSKKEFECNFELVEDQSNI